jgi:hypothetical protein
MIRPRKTKNICTNISYGHEPKQNKNCLIGKEKLLIRESKKEFQHNI